MDPPHIRKLIIKKRKLWKQLRQNQDDLCTRWRYRDCARNLHCTSRQLIVQQETEIIQANNIGAFYKYVNNRNVVMPLALCHVPPVRFSRGGLGGDAVLHAALASD